MIHIERHSIFLYTFLLFILSFSYSNAQPVIGGNEVDISEHPYAVSLGEISSVANGSKWQHHGGGVIINETWLISVAHSPITIGDLVHAGANNATNLDPNNGQLREIISVIPHPLYANNSSNLDESYDITLLELDSALVFNNEVQPISLISNDYEHVSGDPITICGWSGINSNNHSAGEALIEATMSYLTNAEAEIELIANGCSNVLNYTMIAYQDSIAAQATGDSGGPAVVNINGQNELAGLISWKCPVAPIGLPNVSADIRELKSHLHCNLGEATILSNVNPGGIYDQGPYLIDGDVQFDGDFTLSGEIVATETGRIILDDGHNGLIENATFTPCGVKWRGINITPSAGEITMNNVKISRAEKGINNFSSQLKLTDVVLRDCDVGISCITLQEDELVFNFVRVLNSPVVFEDVILRLNGCKFSQSPLTFKETEVRISRYQEIPGAGTETRCAFYESPTEFESGSLYSVGWAYYDSQSELHFTECDFVNICWSKFDSDQGRPIIIDNVTKHFHFGNIFDNANVALELINGASEDSAEGRGKFMNNIVSNSGFVAVINRDDPYVEYWCNFHDNDDRGSYATPDTIVPQGGFEHPAGNIFNNPDDDIINSNASVLTYYWDLTNPASEPLVSVPNAFQPVSTQFQENEKGCNVNVDNQCCNKEDVANVWNGELCPPETWWKKDSDCFDTCTLCAECISPPEPNTEGEGGTDGVGRKISDNNNSNQGFGTAGSQNDASFKYKINDNKDTTANYDATTIDYYNLDGRLVKRTDVKSLQSVLPAGIYLKITRDDNNNILSQEKIFIR